MAAHDRGGARSLVSQHDGAALCNSLPLELAMPVAVRARLRVFARCLGIPDPVRRYVSRIADGQRVIVGRIAQGFDDLECDRFLPLQAVRVDRIHDVERKRLRHLLREPHPFIEVAADLDDERAMHHRLRELSERNLSLRDEHEARDSRPSGIGSRGCRCVARRSANDGPGAAFNGLGDRHRHAAVLERSRRV